MACTGFLLACTGIVLAIFLRDFLVYHTKISFPSRFLVYQHLSLTKKEEEELAIDTKNLKPRWRKRESV